MPSEEENELGAGEMVWQLGALATLIEYPGLVLSNHIRLFTIAYNSSFGDPMSSSDLLGHLHTYATHTDMHVTDIDK